MVKTKKMNENNFDGILKELTAYAETIATRQDEKQTVINDLEKERARLKAGKISKKSLASSLPRVKKEMKRLDDAIKKNIKSLQKAADSAKKMAARQSPKTLKVTMHGASAGSKKKKKSSHNKKRR